MLYGAKINALRNSITLLSEELKNEKAKMASVIKAQEDRIAHLESLLLDVEDTEVLDGSGPDDIQIKFNPEIQMTQEHMLTFGIDNIRPILEMKFDLFWTLEKKKIPKVAIIDTGIDIHDFLKDNIKGGVNYSESSSRTDWIDRNGHGTNVASIVKTICPHVELYAVKVISDDGKGSNESLLRGIDWCIYNDIDVINLSLGSQRPYSPLELKVKEALNSGIFIACAAGNDYRGRINSVDYPGRYDESVFTVAALDKSNRHARFSSAGKEIDIAVRGVNIFGAIKAPDVWGYMTGTSQATPHISGLAASIIGAYPKLSVQDIVRVMKDTAIDLGETGEDDIFGAGLINPQGIYNHLDKHYDTYKIICD